MPAASRAVSAGPTWASCSGYSKALLGADTELAKLEKSGSPGEGEVAWAIRKPFSFFVGIGEVAGIPHEIETAEARVVEAAGKQTAQGAQAALGAAAVGAVVAGVAATELIPGVAEEKKFVPNPWGKLGDPTTRETAENLVKQLQARGLDVEREVLVRTPGGVKPRRFVDVVGTDPATGARELYQIGRTTKAGLPVARERKALWDIMDKGQILLDVLDTDKLFFVERGTGRIK